SGCHGRVTAKHHDASASPVYTSAMKHCPHCKQRLRLPPERPCTVCLEPFQPVRSDAAYCSNACRQWAKRERQRILQEEVPVIPPRSVRTATIHFKHAGRGVVSIA